MNAGWKCLLASSALSLGALNVLAAAQTEPEVIAAQVNATSARTQSTLEAVDGAAAVGVGTHLRWRVTVNDSEREGAELTEPDLAAQLGPAWAIVDGPVDLLDPSVPRADRPDFDQAWTLMPLAGGTAMTPALSLTFRDGATAVVPTASVDVLPSLGESEEVPRPLIGFREAPDRRVGDPRAAVMALGGLLAAVLLLVLWRRSVRRRAAAPAARAPEPAALELIQALEASDSTSGAKMAALAPLFRRAFDAHLDPDQRQRRAALTDLAWAGEVKDLGSADAARLIEELAEYRYGGGEPTTFAVKDALQRAHELIASADRAPSMGTSGPAANPEEAA